MTTSEPTQYPRQTIMRKALLALLLCNGTTSVLGGLAIVIGWKPVETSMLTNSPFSNFVWPGLILTICVGGSALLASILFFKNADYAPLIALLSGAIMATWILAEMLLILQFSWFQIFYLATSIVIIALSGEYIISHLDQPARDSSNHKSPQP